MHFLAMLAFRLPVKVHYDVSITLVSVVPAVLASGIMLHVISQPRISPSRLILGGGLMGAGIGVMHYTGMAAMRMNAVMRYDPVLFVVSVVVAVVLATAALYTKFIASSRHGDVHRGLSRGRRRGQGCGLQRVLDQADPAISAVRLHRERDAARGQLGAPAAHHARSPP
jgi:NO-binding membrane sensor protein with MHYT domain